MKVTYSFILIVSVIVATLCACDKDQKPPISQGFIWECHHETVWDSLNTMEALIGQWQWEYTSCVWEVSEGTGNPMFKNTTIEFKSNNTLEIKEIDQIVQIATWRVVDGDAELYEIETIPTSFLLQGRILFCDELIEFNNSYIDGCDNYFIKVN